MNNIQKPVKEFRAETIKGFDDQDSTDRVEKDGGKYKAGLIRGFAVITRGEALGHGMWIDSEFVQSVYSAMSNKRGLKSRYTHPGMSSDGLSKSLGRAIGSEIDGDMVYSDLHLSKASHKSPDGNLAEHVMTRAIEDAESFGSSIVFEPDYEAQDEFYNDHQVEYEYESRSGEKKKAYRFESPDPLNEKNLPHARLASLRAVDIVDDPAANPDGLFCVDPVYQEIEQCASYALGLSSEKPAVDLLGIEPDRLMSFFQRFLDSQGLELMSKQENSEAVETEENTAPEELSNGENGDSGTNPGDDRADAKRFFESFGNEKGAEYFAAGLSFEDAQTEFAKYQKDEIERLKAENAKLQSSSSDPVPADTLAESDTTNGKRTFASRLRFTTPSSN